MKEKTSNTIVTCTSKETKHESLQGMYCPDNQIGNKANFDGKNLLNPLGLSKHVVSKIVKLLIML